MELRDLEVAFGLSEGKKRDLTEFCAHILRTDAYAYMRCLRAHIHEYTAHTCQS